jgi:hypothetical protein
MNFLTIKAHSNKLFTCVQILFSIYLVVGLKVFIDLFILLNSYFYLFITIIMILKIKFILAINLTFMTLMITIVTMNVFFLIYLVIPN